MSYPTEVKSWKKVVLGKWIIFDSDALISILEFDQPYILDELRKLKIDLAYINPVLLELMNTNDPKGKLLRSKILFDYKFTTLPLTQEEIKLAGQIQESLPLRCQPSPTDLYLGGVAARYHTNSLLITANIKDFPMPIYIRQGHIILQNDHSVKVLSLLSVDRNQLIK